MKEHEEKCCYPLRHDRWCSGVVYQRRHSLFFRVVTLCVLLVIIAGVLHIIFGKSHVEPESESGHVVFFLVFSVAVVVLVLRWLFAPMHKFMRGINALADGNLDFRFEHTGRGEFARLAEAFNKMSGQVEEMVHSKTQLLLDVSHELRSPLTRIKIALEMIPDTPKKQSVMQDIAEMEMMLSELLETESLKTGNGSLSLKQLDLVSAINELIARYESRKPGIELVKSPQRLDVYVDEKRLRRAMQNVVENALKYSQHAGKPVQMSISGDDEHAVIAVKDFGDGISEEEQHRIFEPFYRVDKSRNRKSGGYGLGLSLCREIMRAHRGDIVLTSKPGEGTEIELVFPLNPGAKG